MKNKRPTIKEVARYANVSTATVSYYLNGHFNNMSDGKRREIEKAIEQLKYRPSTVARNLRVQQTKTIGLIVSGITGNLSFQSINGVCEYLNKNGYDAMIFSSGDDVKEERKFIQKCVSNRCEGIIIRPASRENYGLLEQVQNSGIPVVLQSRCDIKRWPYDGVIIDYRAIGNMLEYLHKESFTKVAFFADLDRDTIENVSINKKYRLDVFVSETRNLFNTDGNDLIYYEINNREKARVACKDFIEKFSNEKIAVFANTTQTLLYTYRALQDENNKRWKQVELCGYGGAEWVEVMKPFPITLTQQLKLLGETAAKLVIRRIKNPKVKRQIVLVPSEINMPKRIIKSKTKSIK